MGSSADGIGRRVNKSRCGRVIPVGQDSPPKERSESEKWSHSSNGRYLSE